jgi:Holliday junction resolvase RusA-like endonuclease
MHLPKEWEHMVHSEISTQTALKEKMNTKSRGKAQKRKENDLKRVSDETITLGKFVYVGDFMGKPRMSRADRWKHRDCVDRYFGIKDEVLRQAKGFVLGDSFSVTFYIAMPMSWSKKKKTELLGKPHQQKPDLDNYVKALNDILMIDDSSIWYTEATKVWWYETKFEVTNLTKAIQ